MKRLIAVIGLLLLVVMTEHFLIVAPGTNSLLNGVT